MPNSIRLKEKFEKFGEDLAQPQGNPLTKLAKVFNYFEPNQKYDNF